MFRFRKRSCAPPRPENAAPKMEDTCISLNEASGLRECPICFERRADVETLPHINPPEGSGWLEHCMCAACRASFDSFTCPFCRGKIGGMFVLTPTIKRFVDSFVTKVCAESKNSDQHKHCQWLEMWEAFEFEHGNFISDTGVTHHEGRPDVVAQVAALVMQDSRFAPLLEQGISKCKASHDGNTWLCNGAGVIFRLHGLQRCGSLCVSPALSSLLDRAYEEILMTLEKPGWHGAMLGCLYMQALSAWLAACRCGNGETAGDAEMVRRVGTVLAKRHAAKAGEIKKHTLESYVRLATEPVWKGQDPILRITYGTG